MMQELARERFTVGIMAVATAEGAIENTIAYIKQPTAFPTPIAEFQNTEFKLAECTTPNAKTSGFFRSMYRIIGRP